MRVWVGREECRVHHVHTSSSGALWVTPPPSTLYKSRVQYTTKVGNFIGAVTTSNAMPGSAAGGARGAHRHRVQLCNARREAPRLTISAEMPKSKSTTSLGLSSLVKRWSKRPTSKSGPGAHYKTSVKYFTK